MNRVIAIALVSATMFAFATPAHATYVQCWDGSWERYERNCPPEPQPEPETGNTNTNTNTNSNDNSNSNRNTNVNTQGQHQGQSQGQGQAQGQGQIATGGNATGGDGGSVRGSGNSDNTNVNLAGGGHGGEGGAGGEGGTCVGVGIGGGAETDVDVDSRNTNIVGGGTAIAGGGDANASNGDQSTTVEVNIGEDGPLTASSQEVATSASIEEGAVVVEGDEIVYEAAENVVSSAAPSFSAICSSGGAGTGRNFSLSLAVTNDVCQCLMVADAYMAMGDTETALKWVNAAARHAKWKGGMGYFRHVITLGVM